MFIHWSHVSQRGFELSWPLVGGVKSLPRCQDVSVADYHASADTFAPQRDAARTWMAVARRAGMQYAVLTAKHHDGFALWPTAANDWSIARTPYRGDLIREYVDAARDAGLRVGLYFSLCDWHHPDYPAFADSHRPYRFGQEARPTPEQWTRYREFLQTQLRELLTGYGRIDLLWFDGGWERTSDAWQSWDLERQIREWQPEIVLNDRLPGVGDYDSPEQFVPAEPPARAWETCLTMNDSWGWVPEDTNYKSPHALVSTLCEVAGRGGNLLLNVSPQADGSLPAVQVERLDAVGRWMDAHGASIHGTQPGVAPWQFYGPSTRRDDTIYLHVLARPYESVAVRGVPIRRVRAVRVLGNDRPLSWTVRCTIVDDLFGSDPNGELTIQLPADVLDPLATVVAVEIAPA